MPFRTVLPYKLEESGKIDLYPRTVLQFYPLIGASLLLMQNFFLIIFIYYCFPSQEIICIFFIQIANFSIATEYKRI